MWCDKYRPLTLKKLSYHFQLSELLEKLALNNEFPHLLFYGQSGAGKKTRIMAFLREIFGPTVQKTRSSTKIYEVNKLKKTVELTLLTSPYHIEINPSDAGIYDKIIVQEMIKNMASMHSMNRTKTKFKVIVLEEIDKLTKDAQHGLRRTMEKYMENCRLILCCENISKIIDPLRSRCLSIRVSAPSENHIRSILQKITKTENITVSEEYLNKIVKASERNLRRALLMLQMNTKREGRNELANQTKSVQLPWQIFLDDICNECCREQRPEVLNKVRLKLYELICNCIPPNIIMKQLTLRLMANVDDELKTEIIFWASFHEQRLCKSQKPVPHLLAFIARFMKIYKEWATSILSFSKKNFV